MRANNWVHIMACGYSWKESTLWLFKIFSTSNYI